MSDYKQTRDAAAKVTTQYDKMLRNLDDDLTCTGCGEYAGSPIADRIEQLEANINIKADFIDATINQLAASDQRIEELEAKLATCEKYRDAYAECDRIGTQAVRDLEAELKHQTRLIEQLFALLDKREETDDGRVFHPNELRSCRAADTEKLNKVLAELRSPMKGQNDE